MKIKNNIPNFITSLNLLCGCLSVCFLFQGAFMYAVYAIIAAAIFDFIDGFAARLLHTSSELGKQLDSLADVISFGLAPGVAVFQMLQLSLKVWNYNLPEFILYFAFIIPLFSAWRLAKFNIDERQHESFIGLPTPANALLIFSLLPLISHKGLSPLFPFNDYLFFFILHPAVLLGGSLLFSILLVSNIPLFALKFKGFSWQKNRIRYIFIIISVLLAVLFYFVAVPFIVILYILISIITNHKKTTHEI